MKRYLIILIVVVVASACGNDNPAKSTKDSTEIKTDNTRVDDNSSRGDTASYERMSQKTSDSSGKQ